MSINFPVPIVSSITNSGDSDYNDTTILLHADGSNNSNNTGTFVDASTNNFIITRAGTPAQGSVNPFGSNWSAYFSGASTGTVYVSTATTSSFAFGINNFTIEAWINSASTVSNYPLIIGNYATTFTTNSWGLYYNRIDTGNFYFSASNGSMTIASGSTYVVAGWNHVAVVRNGSTVSLFVNGTQTGSYNYGLNGLDGGIATRLFIGNAGGTDSTTRFNGYISNLRVVNGSAIYTSNFSPSTESLTTVTNTALLTLSSNNFKDVSTNSFITTASSGVSIQRFNPFGNTQTYSISSNTIQGSTYFNGSTGYLTVASNSNLAAGTGNFTVEAWVYTPLSSGTQSVYDARSSQADATAIGFFFGLYSSNSLLFYTSGAVIATGGTIPTNTWTHVAVVRVGNAITCYINGTSVATGTTTNNFTNALVQIGSSNNVTGSSANFFNGYISNLRFVKGTALYTGTFTVSTVALSAVSNTVLLTNQTSQSIADASTISNVITVVGTAVPSLRTPFARVDASTAATLYSGSVYFNGSTDYLSIPSSSETNFSGVNWTIELWFYPTSVPPATATNLIQSSQGTNNWQPYIGIGVNTNLTLQIVINAVSAATTETFNLNSWNHGALVRSGGVVKFYLNGVATSISTTSDISNTNLSWFFGKVDNAAGGGGYLYYFNGYLSNIRFVKGTALYTSAFTPSTIPLTTSSQSSTGTVFLLSGLNAGIYDSTMQNNLITVGSSRVSSTSTSLVKFGSGSVYLDGSSGYLITSPSPQSVLSGNFTIEFWLYPSNTSSAYRALVSSENYSATTGGWSLYQNGTSIEFWISPGSVVTLTASSAITASTWQHLALCRESGTLRLFINGTSVSSTSNSTLLTGQQIWIGDNNAGSYFYNGYIDDLRITNNIARYTATFTPPTASFADIQLLTTATVLQFTTSTNIGSVTLSYNTFTTRWSGISLPTSPTNLTPMNIQDQNNTSTGYFSLPSGTTAQRPDAPQGGYMRFNTTLDSVEYYNSITGWTTIP